MKIHDYHPTIRLREVVQLEYQEYLKLSDILKCKPSKYMVQLSVPRFQHLQSIAQFNENFYFIDDNRRIIFTLGARPRPLNTIVNNSMDLLVLELSRFVQESKTVISKYDGNKDVVECLIKTFDELLKESGTDAFSIILRDIL